MGIRVVDERQHAALVAIGVRVIAETGMPQRVAIEASAMLAIAFFQDDHSFLTTTFPGADGPAAGEAVRVTLTLLALSLVLGRRYSKIASCDHLFMKLK